MHQHLLDVYSAQGIKITEIYYCNHHPLHTSICLCRKPGSLMLEKAIARFDIDASKSYFIGDRERDVIAGKGAGVTGILIDSDQPVSEILYMIA